MVRHSHHHVPAHMVIAKYTPPCCGCGGINRSNLRRDNARKKADIRSGMERLQNMQQLEKKEQIPQYVRDMAGIKIKQQLQSDTVTFAQVLQQKGVTKEKALEKLLDKLVAMYGSEKELMKALKNMEFSKLLEILKKALSTVNESELSKEDTRKKVKDKGDITNKNEEVEEDDDDNEDEDDDNKESKNKKSKKTKKVKKTGKKDRNKPNDSFEKKLKRKAKSKIAEDNIFKTDNEFVFIDENDLEEDDFEYEDFEEDDFEVATEEIASQLDQITEQPKRQVDPGANIKLEIDETEIKFSGNRYSINAVNLLKEQEDLEMNAIRRDMLYNNKKNKTADNPLTRNKPDDVTPQNNETNKPKDTKNKKQLKELENENERLKKIILDLQNERRNKLIAGVNN